MLITTKNSMLQLSNCLLSHLFCRLFHVYCSSFFWFSQNWKLIGCRILKNKKIALAFAGGWDVCARFPALSGFRVSSSQDFKPYCSSYLLALSQIKWSRLERRSWNWLKTRSFPTFASWICQMLQFSALKLLYNTPRTQKSKKDRHKTYVNKFTRIHMSRLLIGERNGRWVACRQPRGNVKLIEFVGRWFRAHFDVGLISQVQTGRPSASPPCGVIGCASRSPTHVDSITQVCNHWPCH